MNFTDIDWADSDLENINIKYDQATLTIWNDALHKRLMVNCSGLAGITNLCIWDDTIIMDAGIYPVTALGDDYIRRLFEVYDKDYDHGGRTLSTGLLELRVNLVNNIPFSVYCQKVDVVENEE